MAEGTSGNADGQDQEPLLVQRGMPVFQNKLYATRQAALEAATGDIELVQCPRSGLVHNRRFDPGLVAYDQDYQNEQGLSPAFQQHLGEVLRLALRHFGSRREGVEIGCGKGLFLEMMAANGMRVRGYDAAYQGANPAVHKRYYDARREPVKPGFVVLRHVLEHIAGPWRFLADLAAGCGPDCLIYIEVPCLDWIIRHQAFFDIFYEHCNYFRLEVLADAFGTVVESGHLFGGQYLYVVADAATFRVPSRAPAPIGKLDFAACRAGVLARLVPGRKTFVWGAGAKGSTFATLMAAEGRAVHGLIDINPVKQGLLTGLSAIEVLPPAALLRLRETVDVIVMNPAYLEEVRGMIAGTDINLVSADLP